MVFGRREVGREVVLAARMAAAASLPRSAPSLSLPPFGLGGRCGGEKSAASWSTAVSAAAAQQRFRPLRRMTLIYGRAAESPPEKEKGERERAEQRWRNGKQEEGRRGDGERGPLRQFIHAPNLIQQWLDGTDCGISRKL